VVLFVALIVLVVMALTGLAMIRQSGTGLSISGNLGLRQNAVRGADLGTEVADAWLLTQANTVGALDNDKPAQGYYSDWGTSDPTHRLQGDPSLYDWGTSVLVTADDGNGNEVRYIVERLCKNANQKVDDDPDGQKCVQTPLGANDKSNTCDHYPSSCLDRQFAVHYRVSSRVKGPRSTVSYIQVLLVPASV
jgi:hypothetical protein